MTTAAATVAVVAIASVSPGLIPASAATAPARLGASLRLLRCAGDSGDDETPSSPSLAELPGWPASPACALGDAAPASIAAGGDDPQSCHRHLDRQVWSCAVVVIALTAAGGIIACKSANTPSSTSLAGNAPADAHAAFSPPRGGREEGDADLPGLAQALLTVPLSYAGAAISEHAVSLMVQAWKCRGADRRGVTAAHSVGSRSP